MLEVLTQKLTGIFRSLGKKGKLTEKEVDVALREIRLALLEADVNFKVVREFLSTVRERAVETEVLQSLTSVQQIVKIVNEEMVGILGSSHPLTNFPLTSSRSLRLLRIVQVKLRRANSICFGGEGISREESIQS